MERDGIMSIGTISGDITHSQIVGRTIIPYFHNDRYDLDHIYGYNSGFFVGRFPHALILLTPQRYLLSRSQRWGQCPIEMQARICYTEARNMKVGRPICPLHLFLPSRRLYDVYRIDPGISHCWFDDSPFRRSFAGHPSAWKGSAAFPPGSVLIRLNRFCPETGDIQCPINFLSFRLVAHAGI